MPWVLVRLWSVWHSSEMNSRRRRKEESPEASLEESRETARGKETKKKRGPFKGSKLSDFVTSRTRDIFTALAIDDKFAEKPSPW